MTTTTTTKSGQIGNRSQLTSLIETNFPSGICHAFGYGSGIFEQDYTSSTTPKMMDLIMVVRSARSFHEELLQRNPGHYSWICRLGGPIFCDYLQNQIGAGVFFHPFVVLDNGDEHNVVVKYGIVEKQSIIQDLTQWPYFYLAGRLQKPTLTLIEDDAIRNAQESCNLPNAVAAAFLVLQQKERKGEVTSLSELFETISSLSYMGDPRLDVGGEDPDKIRKLVHGNPGQLDRFKKLYQPCLESFSQEDLLHYNGDRIQWDSSYKWENRLPMALQTQLQQSQNNVAACLRDIVRKTSNPQSIKGVVTAGISKSTRYAFAKLSKGVLRR